MSTPASRPPGQPPGTDNQRLGQLGEQLAAAHLVRAGWHILDRNWRCRAGEIDIVALDGGQLVVCEVKTRLSVRAGTPVEAVTARKARRLRGLAAAWLVDRGEGGRSIRVDVIGVRVATDGRATLSHVRGAA